MTQSEKVIWHLITNAENIIEELYGRPWDIEDEDIKTCFYAMNHLAIVLQERGNDETDD